MTSTVMKNIENIISETIIKFVSKISDKYKLDEDELFALWEATTPVKQTEKKTKLSSSIIDYDRIDVPKTRKKSNDDVNLDELDINNISNYTIPQLKIFCKAKSLIVSGKKQDLIDRLLKDSGVEETPQKESKKSPAKKKSPVVKKKEKVEPPVITKVNNFDLVIKKNKFNNYEHCDTGLLFDNKTKVVIGKQLPNGEINKNLTDEDIDNCHRYKFKYNMPTNLDNNKTQTKSTRDELDEISKKLKDDQEEIEEEEEEIEEVEEIEDD